MSGTGKKPWRQKGTGRARTGSRRTNIFTGGGVTHGPRPRDFFKKVNAKTRQLALRKALSERIKDGEVVLVDSLKLKTHKTKELRNHILSLKPENAETVLLVSNEQNDDLALAARNLPLLNLVQADTLNTYQVLWPDVVILSREALETVADRLNRK